MNENEIIKLTTENVFTILRQQGFEVKEKKNTFQKTEQLLYLLPKLKDAIKHNLKQIDDLKEYGIPKTSGVIKGKSTPTPVFESEVEIVEKEISKILQRNYIINSQIKRINSILQTVRNDKFYQIIELKYFNNKTYEEMANYFNCEPRTIGRNRNRLINEIKILLFPYDSIEEI
jgi:hypothetical protein